jgi:TetR/AcrR family transcriptional repressor of bet genes
MPKIVDHDQRRSLIVEATCDLIAEEGLDATTMRRIADRAGCTTGLITHHFADKDDVLLAALRAVHRAAGARMTAERERGTPNEQLRSIVDHALPLDGPRRREWRVWLVFWGQVATSPVLVAEQQARYREWSELLATAIRHARADIDVDDLIAFIDGIGVRATLTGDDLPPERISALVTDRLRPRGRPSRSKAPRPPARKVSAGGTPT